MCSLNGCSNPAFRAFTATFAISWGPGVTVPKTLTVFFCESCDLELRQEINK